MREALEGNFAIALDATGSMGPLIDGARRHITEILTRVCAEAGARVRIRIYVYRDYDVPNDILDHSDLTDKPEALVQWLAKVEPLGGGANAGEAIEMALQAIDDAGEAAAVLLAGDEPPNPRADLDARGRRQSLTAFDWARRFGEKTVPIHTFAIGQDKRTIRDFKEIARLSGGQAGRLDGSAEMIDMAVMAMLARLKGARSVRDYMDRRVLSSNAQAFGALLLEGPKG